ncbi:MAG: threonylcarbamoyl-AMP synthase [Deltaproteobacteria bacterium]|nr:threonylcarbamoyl-AMP synthase [Deltaproteobacteria bacterium]
MRRCPVLTVAQAARIVRKGGIVAYPTETFYGLAARADNPDAVGRVFEIKGREKGKPVSILIDSQRELKRWVRGIGPREKKLISRFWPGPLTLVFKARKGVNQFLTGGSGKIGVRISSNPVARRLTRLSGGAITATSANRSGQKPATSGLSARRKLGKKIDGVVSGGRLKRSKGSTILDVSGKKLKVIREGEIVL